MATSILVLITHARSPTKRLSSASTQKRQRLCNRSSRATLTLGPSLDHIHLAMRFISDFYSVPIFSPPHLFALVFNILLLFLHLVCTQPRLGTRTCPADSSTLINRFLAKRRNSADYYAKLVCNAVKYLCRCRKFPVQRFLLRLTKRD